MLSIKSPNPSSAVEPLKRPITCASASPVTLCLPPFLRLRPPSNRVSLAAPNELAVGFRSFHSRLHFNHSVVAFAASHEKSKHSELEVERKGWSGERRRIK
ncbi:protein FATTY ACID EXPORT 3, chloroplastic-like [Hibiscus syriacus]|uniref:protein FATTY ACID EXPORT 3, chloroplastic-like n=1 Tax=Hibiscus syriacus TaxID=106335 RepID=UPI0019236084|nr:protein FATTY ACID EXPORT 3, chloroplastic-like [Hibiscus syriacus]